MGAEKDGDLPALMSLIVAMSVNGCIGKDNQLPWHLRGDLQHFRAATLNKPVIMGRKTWQSIGRPLPKRQNIIVSRQRDLNVESCQVVTSMEQARASAEAWCENNGCDEYFVIGGAEIYALALPAVQRMYMTVVQAEVRGDAWFPDWEANDWRQVSCADFARDEHNDLDFSILQLERRKSA